MLKLNLLTKLTRSPSFPTKPTYLSSLAATLDDHQTLNTFKHIENSMALSRAFSYTITLTFNDLLKKLKWDRHLYLNQ